MSETVLVTGGAGFIGSHLVDALLAQGYRVRVYDSLEPQVHGPSGREGRWPAYCPPEATRIQGDVRDRDRLRQALEGVDVVLHQAAAVGMAQSMYRIEHYVDVNVHGTAVLLDILTGDRAVRDRVRKLIVPSSNTVYGEGAYRCEEHGILFPALRPEEQLARQEWEPRCPICDSVLRALATDEDKPLHPTTVYALTKKGQEELCLLTGRAYGIPTVALRYFSVYGPRQSLSNPYTGVAAIFAGRLLNGQPPVVYEDGLQSRDFVHVSDVVRANLLVMNDPRADYRVFNVGSGRAVGILRLAQMQIDGSGVPCRPEITGKYRVGDIRHCFADISRLQALGYRPQVRFEEGLAELMAWVRVDASVDGFRQAHGELAERGLLR